MQINLLLRVNPELVKINIWEDLLEEVAASDWETFHLGQPKPFLDPNSSGHRSGNALTIPL
jgi:hypothetical protein